jgi:hypothetical protein
MALAALGSVKIAESLLARGPGMPGPYTEASITRP